MKKDVAKNHPRNRLLDCYIRGAATHATITKLPHFSPETPSGADDEYEPCVVYSLNKRRRWELPTNTVRVDEDGVTNIVFDREMYSLQTVWWSLRNNHFSDTCYYSTATDPNLLDMAKKQEKVMGYHVIRAPKNFQKIFENKCTRYMGLRYPDFLGYVTRELLTPLEFELKENEGVDELPGESSEDDVVSGVRPSRFYNLEEHIVVKKPRKPKVRGWTVV